MMRAPPSFIILKRMNITKKVRGFGPDSRDEGEKEERTLITELTA